MTEKRPSTARKHTRSSEAKRSDGLDLGIALTDPDTGVRLSVRMGDVTGRHDAALVSAIGTDFAGLLDAVSRRQGLDLLCAVLWFARTVNGVKTPDYDAMLDDFTYTTVMASDLGEAEAVDELPQL